MILTPRSEPGKWKALTLAVLVHVLLALALLIGMQWRQQAPASMAVEVWRSVPNAAASQPVPVEVPEQVAPPPPPPEPAKAEPQPAPKPEIKAEPKPSIKPDIAVKAEKNAEKNAKETPKEREREKAKAKEPAPKEPPKEVSKAKPESKPEPAKPSFDDALKREMAQLDRQKSLQSEHLRAEQESRQMSQLKADQASAARASGLASYTGKIRGKVRGNVVLPPNLAGNPSAVFLVTQLPSGEVVAVKMVKTSGSPAYDNAIERAILKSSPLPLPDDKADFQRELKLTFCPQEDGKGCQR